MANIGHFDATTVEPREDFSPIPTGEYLAQIVDSDVKPTNSGNGNYAELEYEIMDGEYKGRKVWARLNLDNPNQKAVEIAQRDLSSICHAVGKLQIRDTQELHYKPHIIRVEYQKADGVKNKKDGNDIRGYKPATSSASATSSSSSANTQGAHQAQPAADAAPPWAQKAA